MDIRNASCMLQAHSTRHRVKVISCGVIGTAFIFLNFG